MATTKTEPLDLDQSKVIAGVLALLAAEHEERAIEDKSLRRTESVLAEVGLTGGEIARLLNKPEAGVRKAISRGRATPTGKGGKKRGS